MNELEIRSDGWNKYNRRNFSGNESKLEPHDFQRVYNRLNG